MMLSEMERRSRIRKAAVLMIGVHQLVCELGPEWGEGRDLDVTWFDAATDEFFDPAKCWEALVDMARLAVVYQELAEEVSELCGVRVLTDLDALVAVEAA